MIRTRPRRAPSRLWIDVSHILEWSNPISGVARVQVALIAELARAVPKRIRFCRAFSDDEYTEVKASEVWEHIERLKHCAIKRVDDANVDPRLRAALQAQSRAQAEVVAWRQAFEDAKRMIEGRSGLRDRPALQSTLHRRISARAPAALKAPLHRTVSTLFGAALKARHWPKRRNLRRVLQEAFVTPDEHRARQLRVAEHRASSEAAAKPRVAHGRSLSKSAAPRFARGDALVVLADHWGVRVDLIAKVKAAHSIRFFPLVHDLFLVTSPQLFGVARPHLVERSHRVFALADVVLTTSRYNEEEIVRFQRQSGQRIPRIERVPLGSDIHPSTTDRHGERGKRVSEAVRALAREDYVLYVSTLDPRKNQRLAHQLWRRFIEEGKPVPKLVIAGRAGWLCGDLLSELRADPSFGDRVIWLSEVTDADVRFLYQNCLFTLYPSTREGWGLPVAESLTFGKHCIASGVTSIPEVSQGLATLLDPLDALAWYREVWRAIENPAFRRSREAEIARKFKPIKWRHSANRLLRVIDLTAISPRTARHPRPSGERSLENSVKDPRERQRRGHPHGHQPAQGRQRRKAAVETVVVD